MKTITRNVFSYCDIPEVIRDNSHWINEYQPGCYVPYEVDKNYPSDLDKWFMENYPELVGFEFLIDIDY